MKNKKLLTQKSYLDWCSHYQESKDSYQKYLKESELISFSDWTFSENAHECYRDWCGEDYLQNDDFRFPLRKELINNRTLLHIGDSAKNMKTNQNIVLKLQEKQLPFYDECQNYYGFSLVEIIEFNYDGKGQALILEDGSLGYLDEDTLNFVLFGGWYKGYLNNQLITK